MRPSRDLHPENTTVTALIHFSYTCLPLVERLTFFTASLPDLEWTFRAARLRRIPLKRGDTSPEDAAGADFGCRGLAAALTGGGT
jgi:hypothetical protein